MLVDYHAERLTLSNLYLMSLSLGQPEFAFADSRPSPQTPAKALHYMNEKRDARARQT